MAPVNPDDIEQLLDDAAGGRRAALARLLAVIERGGDGARVLGRLAHPRGGQAYTVGITGAPGAGKSTLTNALCATVREAGDRIAVLAIDPSSPFSGGAILGDRIRMGDHTLDDGVFIRSMATRGHLGGLSLATPSAVRVLLAPGVVASQSGAIDTVWPLSVASQHESKAVIRKPKICCMPFRIRSSGWAKPSTPPIGS